MRSGTIRTLTTISLLVGSNFASARDVNAQQTVGTSQSSSVQNGQMQPPPEDGHLLADKWFHDQRAFPLDHIPIGARGRGLEELDSLRALEASGTETLSSGALASLSSMQWTSIGPMPAGFWNPLAIGGSSGRATALAIDPRNSDIVYMGAAGGGVWKTSDGGTHWTPLTDNQPSLATGAIALDPSNPDILYVGTGEANSSSDSYYGAGILKTSDGGATWTQIAAPFVDPNTGFGGNFGSIAVHPSIGAILLAGTYAGVYRSPDAGMTWTPKLSGGTGYSVLFDPTNGNTAYAALGSIFGSTENGIYKSQDAGQTWSRLTGTGVNTLPTANLGRIHLVMAPSNPSILFASISNCCAPFSGIIGIFKTTDGGANWNKLNNPTDCCGWYGNALTVHPNNPNILVAGDARLFRSLDGGQTWSDFLGANPNLHPDMHALAFSTDGSVLYVANDGGVFSTRGSADTMFNWSDLNATLSTITFYPGLSIDPNDITRAFDGTQDNGTERYSGSPGWTWVACGDGGSTLIDPSVAGTIYVGCTGIDLEKSTDNGASFVSVNSGISSQDRQNFIVTSLAMDPSNPQRLYFGTQRVYQSTNGAASWTPISPDLSNGTNTISTISVALSNPDVVYAGTGDGNFQVTTNATAGSGANWTNHNSGLPMRYITRIAVDPGNADTAYVTLSGFNGSTSVPGHVFKTTNGGTPWTDISGNLPDTPTNGLVIDLDLPNRLYVATDIGVFVTKDAGVTWSSLVQGLPRVVVQDIQIQHATRTLRAATHGRGMWDVALPRVGCELLAIVKASFGKKTGEAGFDPRADVIGDGVVNVIDLSAVARQLPQGTNCH